MLDSKQVKTLGLRFARALQTTVKTAAVFTIEHKSCDAPIQQSFLLLNNLLKEVGQLTFGFVDNQVILNNLLTTDPSLQKLETEFLKRGIAAVTFEPGLTLGRYKRVIHVLAASTATIDAAGGFLAFIDQHEIEGVRILPAAKNQKKNQEGDTILETDSESYILSKQGNEDQTPRDFLDSIDALLESGCFDAATRTEVLSNFAAQGMDGSGYGVPVEVPKLAIVRDGEVVAPASQTGGSGGGPGGGPGGGGSGGGPGVVPGGPGGGPGPGGGGSGGPGGGGSGGPGGGGPGVGPGGGGPGGGGPGPGEGGPGGGYALYAAAGQGTGTGSGAGTGSGYPLQTAGAKGGAGAPPADGSVGGVRAIAYGSSPNAEIFAGVHGRPGASNPATFLELVEASVQRSLQQQNGDPGKSYASLARILRNTGVDRILEHFPTERRQELSGLPPERLAAEYIEDTALRLAGVKLQSTSGNASQRIQVEEEVVFLLGRSLQATHMADRLAQKLSKFILDFAVPPHIQEKIREEMNWTSLNSNKKYARLMELQHYSNIEFRHLLEFTKELVTQRDMDRATALVSHYFDFLDDRNAHVDTNELGRAPELIGAVPLAQVTFASKTAERLGRALLRGDVSDLVHLQAANAITRLAQSIAAFEDFQDVLAIGSALEASASRSREKHKTCCVSGLARLLTPAAIERVVELFLQQRTDSTWSRTATNLLRFATPASIEIVFKYLIREEDARNRLALVRLAAQLGTDSIEVACRFLNDERWYVVRNMCGVLAEFKDPDLVEHIAPVLRHSDARVQKSALNALVKSRSAAAASVLAAALPKLAPAILDEALDELMFLKSPSAVTDLEEFIIGYRGNPACLRKAVQALGVIQDDASLHALTRLYRKEELDRGIRKAALTAISSNPSPLATTLLGQLAGSWGTLATDAKIELEKRTRK